MSTWHIADDVLDLYARGALDGAAAYSTEAHLVTCSACRAALGAHCAPNESDAVWDAIVDVIDRPRTKVVERALRWLGMPDHVARVACATPALSAGWIVSVVSVLVLAVVAARGTSDGDPTLFLVLAPLVPIAGVALSYGPVPDPAYEVGLATPGAGVRLFLLRACSVLVAAFALLGVAVLTLPQVSATAVAWVLPALALVAITLALSTHTTPLRAAVVVGSAWFVGVVVMGSVAFRSAGDLGAADLAGFRPAGQVVALAVTIGAALVFIVRREHLAFAHPE